MCSIFAHYWYYLYSGKLQIFGIYIIYALKHIVFGILVKKYFVTLQLISIGLAEDLKLNRLNRHNYINRNSLVATTARSPGKHYDASFFMTLDYVNRQQKK